jgi:hypothetical protein
MKSKAQDVACERQLVRLYGKVEEFAGSRSDAFDKYDSLNHYNRELTRQLLQCGVSKDMLGDKLPELSKTDMGITTSPDGKFRIYSWDDGSGGTMRGAINVFQFIDETRGFSSILTSLAIRMILKSRTKTAIIFTISSIS